MLAEPVCSSSCLQLKALGQQLCKPVSLCCSEGWSFLSIIRAGLRSSMWFPRFFSSLARACQLLEVANWAFPSWFPLLSLDHRTDALGFIQGRQGWGCVPQCFRMIIEICYVLGSLSLLVSETEFCHITQGSQELEIFLSQSPNNWGYRSWSPNMAFLFGFKWVFFDNTYTNSTITITSFTL